MRVSAKVWEFYPSTNAHIGLLFNDSVKYLKDVSTLKLYVKYIPVLYKIKQHVLSNKCLFAF